MSSEVSTEERFVASMVLSGVGDAIGFRNGRWEFCNKGRVIHDECEKMGGVENFNVILPKWRVSDDTVMHLATAEAFMFVEKKEACKNRQDLYMEIAIQYKHSMDDMGGRSAGATCMDGAWTLKPILKKPEAIQLPFNPQGGGCGAAMRAMCIGLRYSRPCQLDDLIAVSVEAGRMTHHHPTGYLGSLASALFVSYAIQDLPLRQWGVGLMSVLLKAQDYVKSEGRYVQENIEAWSYFQKRWEDYLKLRKIETGDTEAAFPENYGVEERDDFYKSVSYDGWGGASGHDAPMIAYDALLGCGGSWVELIHRGALHAGDSDSTAVTACACYGAMFGYKGVPVCNYENLEYRERLENAGKFFCVMSQKDDGIHE